MLLSCLPNAGHEHQDGAGALTVVDVDEQLFDELVVDDSLVQPRERLARLLAEVCVLRTRIRASAAHAATH